MNRKENLLGRYDFVCLFNLKLGNAERVIVLHLTGFNLIEACLIGFIQ